MSEPGVSFDAASPRALLGALLAELARTPEEYLVARPRLDALAEKLVVPSVDSDGEQPGANLTARPATTAEVEAWKKDRHAAPPVAVARVQSGVVRAQALLSPLGPVELPIDGAGYSQTLDRLEACVRSHASWSTLPAAQQVRLTEMLVAWVKALLSDPGRSTGWHGRTATLLRQIGRHHREARPGHVHGLALDHAPRAATWLADTRAAQADLSAYAFEPHLPPRPARRLRATTRPASRPGPRPVSPTVLARTRDLRVAIVCAGAREQAGNRIQRAFELRELEWVEIAHSRAAQRLAQRIRGGSIDLVLMTRFLNHSDGDRIVAAATERGVPIVRADSYGVTAIELALGRLRP